MPEWGDGPAPSVTGSSSAQVLPMTDEEKAAAAKKPKHPLGFSKPKRRRRSKQ